MSRQFLFGYGSLINQESRSITGITKNPVVVTVRGFERSWCVQSPSMRLTGLGIFPNADARCNGVLVELDPDQLAAFDERELGGSDENYARVQVPHRAVEGPSLPGSAIVWAYIVRKPSLPTSPFPIAQSYLDVILMGCLDFGEPFAAEFVGTTSGWDSPWVDDRSSPRYVRHLAAGVALSRVDDVLKQAIPATWLHRVVDAGT